MPTETVTVPRGLIASAVAALPDGELKQALTNILRPIEDFGIDRAFFFGCWSGTGHYYVLAQAPGRYDRRPHYQKSDATDITPWGYAIDNHETYYDRYDKQGSARLHYKDGWTALAVCDRTVDSRPHSHAAFIFPTLLSVDQAIDAAHHWFPHVAKRVGPIVPDARPSGPT